MVTAAQVVVVELFNGFPWHFPLGSAGSEGSGWMFGVIGVLPVVLGQETFGRTFRRSRETRAELRCPLARNPRMTRG